MDMLGKYGEKIIYMVAISSNWREHYHKQVELVCFFGFGTPTWDIGFLHLWIMRSGAKHGGG
jgi:hypothetical protein